MMDEKTQATWDLLEELRLPDPMRMAFARMLKTFAGKNKDYSHGSWRSSFDEVADGVGTTGGQVCETLLELKRARLRALSSNGRPPANESVDDTYLDRAVYAALAFGLYLDDATA